MTDEPSESGPASDGVGPSETREQSQTRDADAAQTRPGESDPNANPDRDSEPDTDPVTEEIPLPFDGPTLVKTGLKASIGPSVLPRLLRRAQRLLSEQIDMFHRQHERVHTDEERVVFLANQNYWTHLGAELGFNERETDAVRRAHEAQLLRIGDETGRSEEFETAMEIRQSVVIAADSN